MLAKIEKQKEYFYLIYMDHTLPNKGYLVLQRLKDQVYTQEGYPEKLKKRWLEIRPV